MKKLTKKDSENLSLEKSEEIIGDFGVFMDTSIPMHAYEDELPWDKNDVLLSLLKALKSTNESDKKEFYSLGILFLFSVIPTRDQLEDRIAAREKIEKVNADIKAGLSTDEILKKYND